MRESVLTYNRFRMGINSKTPVTVAPDYCTDIVAADDTSNVL
jgi:hypothetical protein